MAEIKRRSLVNSINKIEVLNDKDKLKKRNYGFNNRKLLINYLFPFLIIIFLLIKGNYNYSYITLIINAKGNISVFQKSGSFTKPDEIYINEEKKAEVNSIYYFTGLNNTVKLIWNTSVISTSEMFFGCSDIIKIDFSNFDSSYVKKMENMFFGCSSLKSLDLSKFNTSKITDMYGLFYGCSSLISLNLSNFDTSKDESMVDMFHGCSLLISLDLSGFDTIKLKNTAFMFYGCSSLTSLDLSTFNSKNLQRTSFMFNGCSSLTYINLSNFDTSSISNMKSMFQG